MGGVRALLKTVLLATLITSLLAGCGGGSTTSKSTGGATTGTAPANQPDGGKLVKLTVIGGSGGSENDTLQQQLIAFMKANPNIQVAIQQVPWSSTDQLNIISNWLNAGSDTPDVLRLDIVWPAQFSQWLLPLDKYFTKDDLSDFLPGPVAADTINGHLVAVPAWTDAGLLYYRKDLLAKYGLQPPKTWAELKQEAKTIGEKEGIDGFLWQGAQYEGLVCDFNEWIISNNGAIIKDGKVVVNSPQLVEALKMAKDLIASGVSPKAVLNYQEEDVRNAFQQGKAVFIRNWPYVWVNAQDPKQSKVVGKIGAMPLPAFPGGKSAATLGGWNYSINKYSKHPDEAAKLVAFLTSADQQAYAAIHTGHNPTRKSVYEKADVLKANPFYKDLYSVFINAVGRPQAANYGQVSDQIQIYVHKALTGELSPEEAMKQLQDQLQQVYKP